MVYILKHGRSLLPGNSLIREALMRRCPCHPKTRVSKASLSAADLDCATGRWRFVVAPVWKRSSEKNCHPKWGLIFRGACLRLLIRSRGLEPRFKPSAVSFPRIRSPNYFCAQSPSVDADLSTSCVNYQSLKWH